MTQTMQKVAIGNFLGQCCEINIQIGWKKFFQIVLGESWEGEWKYFQFWNSDIGTYLQFRERTEAGDKIYNKIITYKK